jgi:DNA-binding GntR family transcriptional regulator
VPCNTRCATTVLSDHTKHKLSILIKMDFAGLVTPLTRQTLSGDVYLQLRDLLLYGRAMPGEQLSLRTIAEALGVSVMPVREAVHRLVAEQALEVSSSRALRVPVLTVSQFREITSIRVNLEGLATAQAATRLDEAAYQAIEAQHMRFSREISSKRPDKNRLIAFNKDLHFAIYSQAGMPMLMQMIESLWLRIGPILNYDLRSGYSRIASRVPDDHHARLVDALKRHDVAAATEALRDDIQGAADHIISQGVLVTADAAPGQTAKASEFSKGAKRLRESFAAE